MRIKLTFEIDDELLKRLATLPRFRQESKGVTKDALEAEILHVVRDHFVSEVSSSKAQP